MPCVAPLIRCQYLLCKHRQSSSRVAPPAAACLKPAKAMLACYAAPVASCSSSILKCGECRGYTDPKLSLRMPSHVNTPGTSSAGHMLVLGCWQRHVISNNITEGASRGCMNELSYTSLERHLQGRRSPQRPWTARQPPGSFPAAWLPLPPAHIRLCFTHVADSAGIGGPVVECELLRRLGLRFVPDESLPGCSPWECRGALTRTAWRCSRAPPL